MAGIENEERWLIDWFRKQNLPVDGLSDAEIIAADYFQQGFIDSFGIVNLIADAEDAFQVRFDERDFQDRRFSTVSGLAEIVRSRKNS